jgi:hypothetical protein
MSWALKIAVSWINSIHCRRIVNASTPTRRKTAQSAELQAHRELHNERCASAHWEVMYNAGPLTLTLVPRTGERAPGMSQPADAPIDEQQPLK